MVIIKAVSRSAKKEARDTSDHKYVRRNLDPSQHPFAAARERLLEQELGDGQSLCGLVLFER